jgi:hypothetical protein
MVAVDEYAIVGSFEVWQDIEAQSLVKSDSVAKLAV